MEFDGEIENFKVLEEKSDSSDFRFCYAINEFSSLLRQDSNGPYNEKERE